MSNTHFTHQQLVDASAEVFASNSDVEMLLATTHDGSYYRPEFRQHAFMAARAHGAEVVEIHQVTSEEGKESPATTSADTLVEALAGALHLPGFLLEPGQLTDAPAPIAPAAAAAAPKTTRRKATTKKADAAQ